MKNKLIFSDRYKCCKPTDIFMAEFVGGVSMINQSAETVEETVVKYIYKFQTFFRGY